MDTNWEYKYKFFKKSIYKSLVADYKLNMKEAKDKSYTHNQLVFKLTPIFHKVQGNSKVLLNPSGNIMDLRNNIIDLIKTKKKYNYSTAFELSTSEYNDSIKLKIVENLAEVEAYIDFSKFIEEQTKELAKKEIEVNKVEDIDDDPKFKALLTRLQQTILLHILKILELDGIKDLSIRKQSILFSHLLNRSQKNMEKLLVKHQKFNPNKSELADSDIEKINTLLQSIGFTDKLIN